MPVALSYVMSERAEVLNSMEIKAGANAFDNRKIRRIADAKIAINSNQ